MIKVGIIGATGYAGSELVRILLAHKEAEIVWYGSRSYIDQKYASIYQNFFQLVDAKCLDDNMEELAKKVDVIFTATPQGLCASLINEDILSKTKVIDLSADFRIKDVKVYEEWYKIQHKSPQYIDEAVYGLCEINREDVKGARLVANPGCYTTCSILAMVPLLKYDLIEHQGIIVDAKSGTSGAGRSLKAGSLYCAVNESFKAYGVASHRHTPEIEQIYSEFAGEPVVIQFTPHLLPVDRGILATCYGQLKEGVTDAQIEEAYQAMYGKEFFIRLRGKGGCPELKNVRASNYVDLGWQTDKRTGRIIVMNCIDNLVKGAAGQAVQNMNVMFGIEETAGLRALPIVP